MRFLLLASLLACAAPPDRVVVGTIRVDAETTSHAMAIRDGVVVALGDDAAKFAGVVDTLETNDVVMPGMIDAHVHLMPGSFVLDRLFMYGAGSMDSILSTTEDYMAAPPSEPWIVGYGWISNATEVYDGRRLDALIPDRPALIADATGHAGLVNSVAMAMAGITEHTPDPPGGEIVRDEQGQPTGLLLEDALNLVSDLALSQFDDAPFRDSIAAHIGNFSAGGVTGMAEILASPGFDLSRPQIYDDLSLAGELPVRAHLYLPVFVAADLPVMLAMAQEERADLVRVAGLKVWVDGSMGHGNSWMREPLEGRPDDFGASYFNTHDLIEVIVAAEQAGLQVKFHVNGDAAVGAALDALDAASDQVGGLSQSHVFDHVVYLTDLDRERMNLHGVIASIQPTHALVSSLGISAELWGEERFAGAYDNTAFEQAGIATALGTDWPVWPFAGMKSPLQSAALEPHPLSVAEAFRAATVGAAASVGWDGGTLEVGKPADFLLVDQDPLTLTGEALGALDIRGVVVAGHDVR